MSNAVSSGVCWGTDGPSTCVGLRLPLKRGDVLDPLADNVSLHKQLRRRVAEDAASTMKQDNYFGVQSVCYLRCSLGRTAELCMDKRAWWLQEASLVG